MKALLRVVPDFLKTKENLTNKCETEVVRNIQFVILCICICFSNFSLISGAAGSTVIAAAIESPIVEGSNAKIIMAGPAGDIMWQESVNGSTGWIYIADATSVSYETHSLMAGTYYYRAVVKKTSSLEFRSNVVRVIVTPAQKSGGKINGISRITYGDTTFHLTLTGYSGTIKNWEKKLNSENWQIIDNILPVYSEKPSGSGIWHYRVLLSAGSTDLYSDEFSLIVARKELTITGARVVPKIYDGNTEAKISDAVLSGVLSSDVVTLVDASKGFFDHYIIGTSIPVLGEMTISGPDAENYILIQPLLEGEIMARELTLNAEVIKTKSSDGKKIASIENASLSGVLEKDDVKLKISSNDPNITIAGFDAGNYILSQPEIKGSNR